MPQPITLDSPLALKLQEEFQEKILEISDYRGDLSIRIPKEQIVEIATTLKENSAFQFEQMMDLTAVDYLNQKKDFRFQVVYHFFSLTHQHRLRVKCNLVEEDFNIPSIHSLWKAVNWYERECYDMYGIQFTGHPNLKRLILYEGFEGHPLRKDYPIQKQQPRVPLREIPERHDYL